MRGDALSRSLRPLAERHPRRRRFKVKGRCQCETWRRRGAPRHLVKCGRRRTELSGAQEARYACSAPLQSNLLDRLEILDQLTLLCGSQLEFQVVVVVVDDRLEGREAWCETHRRTHQAPLLVQLVPEQHHKNGTGARARVEYYSLRLQWIPRPAPSVIPALQVANVLSAGIHQQLRRTGA